jgi:hypothetical protein
MMYERYQVGDIYPSTEPRFVNSSTEPNWGLPIAMLVILVFSSSLILCISFRKEQQSPVTIQQSENKE